MCCVQKDRKNASDSGMVCSNGRRISFDWKMQTKRLALQQSLKCLLVLYADLANDVVMVSCKMA
jgi:hypothetical protein